MTEIRLRGVTFDHPRATKPILESARVYKEIEPNVTVEWIAHPLEAFETFSIQKLAEQFDLIVFDHPFIGEVVRHNSLYAFNELLDQDQLNNLSKDILGNSLFSYMANGKLWALPIDGASQMAAYQVNEEDQFTKINASIENLLNASKDSEISKVIAFPLVPTHASCTFLTLAYSLFGEGQSGLFFFDESIFKPSLELLQKLASAFNPISFEVNPIQLLDLMSSKDEIKYSPFIFGYSPYAVSGFRDKILKFVPTPSFEGRHSKTILGGAGIGISKNCMQAEVAARYAHWLTSPEVQGELFPVNLGQPASISGWKSSVNSEMSQNFFQSSYSAIENAFVRPRIVGWPKFQEVLGEILISTIKNKMTLNSAFDAVNSELISVCDLSQNNLFDISDSRIDSLGVK